MATHPEYFRKFPCFRDLTDEQLGSIANISNAVCYPPNHVLFREGEKGKYLYFLVKGDVEVLYNLGEENQVRVDKMTDEEIAGCAALVEPYTYAATERSLTEIEVLEVDLQGLQALIQEDCQLGLNLQQYIIKILNDRILELRMSAM